LTRIGVVGCGKIAEKHFNAYRRIEEVDVLATDIDPDKESIAEERGVAWVRDRDTLFERDLDAVDVCTPVTTHAEIIHDALEAGYDVFCEKPLAESAEEAAKIRDHAERADATLVVGYLYRFHPAFEWARTILTDGIIGDPYYAIFRVGGRGSASAWKHDADAGGGAANEMLVHMLDLATWYFGEPDHAEALYVDTLLETREIDGESVSATAEDVIMLRIQTSADVEIVCQSDLVTPSYMNYVEIQGTNGSLFTTILDYFPSFVYCNNPRGVYDRGHNFREFEHVDLFERELRHFVESVRGDLTITMDSLTESSRIHRLIDDALG
jgi:predicted dehydrogenase